MGALVFQGHRGWESGRTDLSSGPETGHDSAGNIQPGGSPGHACPKARRGEQTISEDLPNPMKRLTDLIKKLSPFLDSHGRAYCYIKSETHEASDPELPGIVTELDGEAVFSLLSYWFDDDHLIVPSRAVIRQALDVARGKLWATQPSQSQDKPMWSATVRAIALSARTNGEFVGSAARIWTHLRDELPLKPEDLISLPKSADQMGVVLIRIGLLLRQQNIELSRPPRRDRERLWCWRLLVPDHDTSDTPDTSTSGVSASSNGQVCGNPCHADTPDTSERERTLSKISGILEGSRQ